MTRASKWPMCELRRNHHLSAGGQAQHSAVEELVMHGAQAQSVGDDIGAVHGPPLDVCSFEADGGAVESASFGGKLLSIFIVLIGLGVVAVPSGLLASALYKHDSQTA